MSQARALLSEMPSVDRLLNHARAGAWLTSLDRAYVTRRCREVLEELRREIGRGDPIPAADLDEGAILDRVERRILLDRQPSLTRVVNATGTILHTNLGRAVLPQSA